MKAKNPRTPKIPLPLCKPAMLSSLNFQINTHADADAPTEVSYAMLCLCKQMQTPHNAVVRACSFIPASLPCTLVFSLKGSAPLSSNDSASAPHHSDPGFRCRRNRQRLPGASSLRRLREGGEKPRSACCVGRGGRCGGWDFVVGVAVGVRFRRGRRV